MELTPGVRLGPYEIVEPVGAGGMGEVYRARDTRLGRNVAIKVLPTEFAQDTRLRRRFEREAKTISALNHPHICMLHDIGRDDGVDYLVLEFCEGQTLAGRIARGPMPVEQVLRHGRDIAGALSRAHHAGIVHRDLKPGNIMLTKSGVKLLDFGLARQLDVDVSAETRTLEREVTSEGTVVGTPRYMAPEVIQGADADARSDIFALGLVLYEMLSGKPAFTGTSRAALIAAILERQPEPIAGIPQELQHVIDRCLAKSPDERWESAHDIAEQLHWISEAPVAVDRPRSRKVWPFVAAAVAIAVIGFAAMRFATPKPKPRLVRLSIPLEGEGIDLTGAGQVAISADAKRIAYFADRYLWVRDLDSFTSVRIAGLAGSMVFSPDGEWIAYNIPGGGWMRVRASGGEPRPFAQPPRGAARGATWAADGSLYCTPSSNGGIWRLTDREARQITTPNAAAGESSHRCPWMLPDGKHLLFTIRTNQITTFDDATIAVLSLDTGKWNAVLEGGADARYAAGRLFYGRGGAVYAVPFDERKLVVTGTPQKVADGVLTTPSAGITEFDVAANGDLVYAPGGILAMPPYLLTVDRAGTVQSEVAAPIDIDNGSALALAPDGRRVAMISATANADVWLYDLETARSTRFSFEPGDEFASVWTADGSRIVYTASAPDRLLMKEVDGSAPPVELARIAGRPLSVSPDGKQLVFVVRGLTTNADLWVLSFADRTIRPLIATPFVELIGLFSPDGRWLVYSSNQTGRREVYVHSMTTGADWQVSVDGADWAAWSRDGKEILYRNRDDYFAVPVTIAGTELRPGKPQRLFSMPGTRLGAILPDGMLLLTQDREIRPVKQLNLILNAN